MKVSSASSRQAGGEGGEGKVISALVQAGGEGEKVISACSRQAGGEGRGGGEGQQCLQQAGEGGKGRQNDE